MPRSPDAALAAGERSVCSSSVALRCMMPDQFPRGLLDLGWPRLLRVATGCRCHVRHGLILALLGRGGDLAHVIRITGIS